MASLEQRWSRAQGQKVAARQSWGLNILINRMHSSTEPVVAHKNMSMIMTEYLNGAKSFHKRSAYNMYKTSPNKCLPSANKHSYIEPI